MDLEQNAFLATWCKLLLASFLNQVNTVKILVNSILNLGIVYESIDDIFARDVEWSHYYHELTGGHVSTYDPMSKFVATYWSLDKIHDDVRRPVTAAILGGASDVLEYFYDELGVTPDSLDMYTAVHYGTPEILSELLYREPHFVNIKLGQSKLPLPAAIVQVSYVGFFNQYNWIRYSTAHPDRALLRTLALLDTFLFVGDSDIEGIVYHYNGRSFLHEAILKGVPVEICRWVLKNIDYETMSIVSYNGTTALHAAIHRGLRTIATDLIMAGCDTTVEPSLDRQLNPERMVSPLIMIVDFVIFGVQTDVQQLFHALLVCNAPFNKVKNSVRPYVCNGAEVAWAIKQVGLNLDLTPKFRAKHPDVAHKIIHEPLTLQRLASNAVRQCMMPGSRRDFRLRIETLPIPSVLHPYVIMSDMFDIQLH